MPARIYLQVPARHVLQCLLGTSYSACSARPTVPARHVLQCLLGTSYSACSALLSACSALPTRPPSARPAELCFARMSDLTHGSLTGKKTPGFGGYMPSAIKQNHATPCKIKQNHVMQKPCEKPCKTRYSSGPYIDIRTRLIAFCSAKPCEKRLFSPTIRARMIGGECAAEQKKLAP